MGLDVSLSDYIEAHLAAELEEPRRVWIVGSSDAVDVMLLHDKQICHGLLTADGIAGYRVAVVAVYTEDLDLDAVEVYDTVDDLDLADTDLLSDVLVVSLDDKLILVWMLSIPELRLVDGEIEDAVLFLSLAYDVTLSVGKNCGNSCLAVLLKLNADISVGEIVV